VAVHHIMEAAVHTLVKVIHNLLVKADHIVAIHHIVEAAVHSPMVVLIHKLEAVVHIPMVVLIHKLEAAVHIPMVVLIHKLEVIDHITIAVVVLNHILMVIVRILVVVLIHNLDFIFIIQSFHDLHLEGITQQILNYLATLTFIKLFVLLQLAIAAFIIKVFKFQHPFRYQLPVVVEFELSNWPFLALIVNDVEPFVIKAKPIVVTLG
jgi:hypothetical protein